MSNEVLNESMMMDVLNSCYEKAINGLPKMETAQDLAEKYLRKHNNVDDAINEFVNWQTAKCTTSGFLTGLGGLITLPVALPANITSVLYVQIRMIAAIAYMRGYDLKDDQVRTFVYVALTGQAATDILKQAGIKIGTKMSATLIKKIPFAVIKQINKAVGFRMITKFGQKGVINLGKCIPVVGGVIGGGADLFSTRTIAKTAKKVFI